MKKSKILEIHFQPLKDFKKEVKQALRERKKLIQPHHHIYFESVADFRKFMTIQKIELLTTIAIHEPTSIYELAKLVDRDFAAVLRDCTGLELTGFMKFQEAKGSKKSKAPTLAFDYTCISVRLPKSGSYQIEFKEAA